MNSVKIIILPSISKIVDSNVAFKGLNSERLINEGNSVGSLLNELAYEYGRLFIDSIYNPDTRKIADGVNILINGTPIHAFQNLDTVIHHSDTIAVVPIYLGG